jgi:hypothetical protein
VSTRFLVAHAAREPASDVAEIVGYIKRRIPDSEVTTAREQWQTRLGSSGSADQLALDLGSGSSLSGEPLFHVIVCPRQYIGKRTAKTVESALASGRTVFYMNGMHFVQVGWVKCVDQTDWKTGWMLCPDRSVVVSDAVGPDAGGDGIRYE